MMLLIVHICAKCMIKARSFRRDDNNRASGQTGITKNENWAVGKDGRTIHRRGSIFTYI